MSEFHELATITEPLDAMREFRSVAGIQRPPDGWAAGSTGNRPVRSLIPDLYHRTNCWHRPIAPSAAFGKRRSGRHSRSQGMKRYFACPIAAAGVAHFETAT